MGVVLAGTRLNKRLRAVFVLAILGVAGLSLAACGRAGPPEPPPGPLLTSQPVAAIPAAPPAPAGSSEDARERQYEKAVQNGFDKNGNPVAPPSERKSFILDFLLQ